MTVDRETKARITPNGNDYFFRDDQPPPHDLQLEKAVLGAMLLEEESRIITSEKIRSPEVFYYPSHQKIFSAIIKESSDKRSKTIDIFSVSSFLNKEGLLKSIGGEEYLLELQNSIATTANIERWSEILCSLSSLRKMIATCASVINSCYQADIDNVNELLSKIESSIFSVRDVNSPIGATKVEEHIEAAVKYLEALHERKIEATGLSTGFSSLDNIIIGLKNQEMIVIAARPSIGKTSLALNIATHIAMTKKKNVAFFSLEMSADQVTRRLLCSIAEISEKDFYDKRFNDNDFGVKWSKITKAATGLSKSNLYIDPTPALTVFDLRAKAVRLKAKLKIDVIIIDYLQLMKAEVNKNDTRQVEVSNISTGIKSLAKELNIPIVVLAQLNRQAEQQDRPKLSHLRESGAIEQDADIVMFLHRDRDPQKDISVESVEAELIVEKNRNGQTGIAKLVFFPKITTFRSLSRYNEGL